MPHPPPEPSPKPKKKKLTEKQIFILAERTQESGGNYLAVNGSSGALGAYQVMPANLPGWLRASGQRPMSAYQYLHSRAAQDRLAWVILGGYYDRYGPRGAASMWYSGQPNWRATYGNPPVYVYVNDVIALMARGGFPVSNAPGPSSGGGVGAPPKNEGDWSHQVAAAAAAHTNAAAGLAAYASALNRIR